MRCHHSKIETAICPLCIPAKINGMLGCTEDNTRRRCLVKIDRFTSSPCRRDNPSTSKTSENARLLSRNIRRTYRCYRVSAKVSQQLYRFSLIHGTKIQTRSPRNGNCERFYVPSRDAFGRHIFIDDIYIYDNATHFK